MKLRLQALALALVAASFAGGGAPRAAEFTSNDGTYLVTLRSEPAAPPMNVSFAVEIAVRAADGEGLPAADVELVFDARMPAHRHGMRRRPVVRSLGEGRFRVEGVLLHMPGTWELHFDFTRGAITERAQWRVELD